MRINFKITNIDCEACVKLSRAALDSLPGVKKIEINKDGLTALESDRDISFAEIKDALAKIDKNVSLI